MLFYEKLALKFFYRNSGKNQGKQHSKKKKLFLGNREKRRKRGKKPENF